MRLSYLLSMRSRRPPITVRRLAAPLLASLALACAGCGSAGRDTSGPAAAPTSTATPTSSSTTVTPSSTNSASSTTTTVALPGAGKPTVTIGDKNYTEQFILGELYQQALEAQGFSVDLDQNIGPTDVTLSALASGRLAMYPEYLNVFNSTIAGDQRHYRTSLDAYQAAQRYALGHGLQLLDPTPFSDTDAIGVTVGYALANHLNSIRDLRRVAPMLTIGGPPQFQQSSPGLPAIEQTYGFMPAAYQTLAIGTQYPALDAETIQAADVNTTDAQLASGDYRLLADPRDVFGWGNVVPVVSNQALAAEGPVFESTINRVSALLTTPVMRQLNQDVDVSQQDPAAVAKQFLETHGLVAPTQP
jgi:osmoprotectant transport system substrate-binding protein